MIQLALGTGQPLTDLLGWNPRDVDTVFADLEARAERAEQAERDDRFAAMRAELARRMGG